MKKLPLSIEGDNWLEIFQHTETLGRKFHTIKVENSNCWTANAIKTLSSKADEVRNFELIDCNFNKKEILMLTKILGSFVKLESLTLNRIGTEVFEAHDLDKVKPVNLSNLKKVVVNECQSGVS